MSLTLQRAQELIANNPVGTSRYSNADIQADIAAAEGIVANAVGPLSPESVTVTVCSRSGIALLPLNPYVVDSLTAATSNAVPYTLTAVTVDPSTGILRGLPDGVFQLTYQAGWDPLPPEIGKAVEEQFKHIWGFRRGNTRTADAERGAAHAMPFRVSELIEPYRWGRS